MTYGFKRHVLSFLIIVILSGGCITPGFFIKDARDNAKILPDSAAAASAGRKEKLSQHQLETDLKRLSSFVAALEKGAAEMKILSDSVNRSQRGYYTSEEHDRVENLLFRYLMVREALWDMLHYYYQYQEGFSNDELRAKGFIIGLNAALLLTSYSSGIVAAYMDEPVVTDKLNESFFRHRIPKGTYDKLFHSVTNVDHVEALKTAWFLYREERANDSSFISRIHIKEKAYRELMELAEKNYALTIQRIQMIMEKQNLMMPEVTARLQSSAIMENAREMQKENEDNLYVVRALLFTKIGDIKIAKVMSLDFSPKQIQDLKATLKPGDVIFTYTTGYMSNVFGSSDICVGSHKM